MVFGKVLGRFIQESPVAVLVNAIVERSFGSAALDQLFEDSAVEQFTVNLAFSQITTIMSDIVSRTSRSINAWYKDFGHTLDVVRNAVYQKLRRVEPHVSAELVRYSAGELAPVIEDLYKPSESVLPGYRVLVLDGNHLAGTEHRLEELRRTRSAPLPGQALVLYDPAIDLVVDAIPCEDAYAQERSLLGEVLERVAPRTVILADRNFCTAGFLSGLVDRQAFCIIRQHKSLTWEPLEKKRRKSGRDPHGRNVYEQAVAITDPQTGQPHTLRRISFSRLNVTRDQIEKGDTEIHLLTNLPDTRPAAQIAEAYWSRWTIEAAFQRLERDLRSEIDTLAYPRAALFGFCVSLVAYNITACVKAALTAVHGAEFLSEQLSTYHLTREIADVTPGLRIAIPNRLWIQIRNLSTKDFCTLLKDIARAMRLQKYTKDKRGPRKPRPKQTSGRRHKHVATQRLIAARDHQTK